MIDPNTENIRNIYPLSIHENKVFTQDEAIELISLLTIITSKTKKELNILNSQLSCTKGSTPQAKNLQEKINQVLQNWSDKVKKLGAQPVSLCKVKIQGNNETYFWEYPQTNLQKQ